MKRFILILITWALTLSALADKNAKLVVLEKAKRVPMVEADVKYRSFFSKYDEKKRDKYAVLVVNLDAQTMNSRAVTMAKQRLGLDMGTSYHVEDVNKEQENTIFFLVNKGAKFGQVTCGDGCQKQPFLEYGSFELEGNAVYTCKVQYIPEDEEEFYVPQSNEYVSLTLVISPKTAEVRLDGMKTKITDGVFKADVSLGKHTCVITSADCHDFKETLVFKEVGKAISKTITLNPYVGTLLLTTTPRDAHIQVDNILQEAGKETLSLPVGKHKISIARDGWLNKDTIVTIVRDKRTTASVRLSNMNKVHLTTESDVQISIRKEHETTAYRMLGTGEWSGELELGTYSVKTSKSNHADAYTTITVGQQAVSKTLSKPDLIKGRLFISSNPSGASAYVDGQYMGTTPCAIPLTKGNHSVYVKKAHYYTSSTKTIEVKSDNNSVYFDLSYEPADDDHPDHYLETSYGLGLSDISSRPNWTAHYVGLDYTWIRGYVGLRANPMFGISSERFAGMSVTAGPVFRLTPMYCGLNLQLLTGAGLYWDTRNTTWAVDGGLRFGFHNGDDDGNFAWWSLGLGFKYFDNTLMPTFNLSLMPARILGYAGAESYYGSHHWLEPTVGGMLGGPGGLMLGATYAYNPTHLGFFTSFGVGVGTEIATVTTGLDFRLLPDYVSDVFDWHIYGGGGWGMYSGDHYAIGDVGMRFAFSTGSKFSWWSFSFGTQFSPAGVGLYGGVSIGIVGMLATLGLGAIFL